MRERVEYYLLRVALWLSGVLPKSWLYKGLNGVASLVYRLDSRRRTLTISNLKSAFPEKSEHEIEEISRDVYRSLSRTVAEILLLFSGRTTLEDLISNSREAAEKLRSIREKKGQKRGVLFLSAHFSNWEMGAHFIPYCGFDIYVVGRKGNNRLIEENFTRPMRELYGGKALSKEGAMVSLVKALKKGSSIGLLLDQKAGRKNSVKVDFFGRPAETTLSAAILKRRLDPLVVPVFAPREDDGRYRLIVMDPVEVECDGKSEDECLKAMTQAYTVIIEDMIRQYPSQWFWMHNRWRT